MSSRTTMHKLLILFALPLVACVEADGWEDMPGSVLTPRSDGTTVPLDEWTGDVRQAANVWNAQLTQRGCEAPFTFGDGGHEIRLVPTAQWTHGPRVAGVTHDYPDERVEIRESAEPERDEILMHELGHAIGLQHADPADGPSIMLLSVYLDATVQPRDLDDAACLLGCGPCH